MTGLDVVRSENPPARSSAISRRLLAQMYAAAGEAGAYLHRAESDAAPTGRAPLEGELLVLCSRSASAPDRRRAAAALTTILEIASDAGIVVTVVGARLPSSGVRRRLTQPNRAELRYSALYLQSWAPRARRPTA